VGKGGHGFLRHQLESLALKHHFWLNMLAERLAKVWTVILIYEDEPGALLAARQLSPKPQSASSDLAERWWNNRWRWSLDRLRDYFARGGFVDTLDLWGRWEDLPLLERRVREAVSPHAFVMSHFSHFDDVGACLYVTIAGAGGSERERAERHGRAWRAGLDACAAIQGCRVNHHHGVGLAKLPWLDAAVDASWLSRLKGLKNVADPQGLLNPGKLGLCR
jgi:FAD/FMN-containing dehydrogenase